MIKKTVIKRAYKLWPKTERLDEVMNHLNTTNAEGISDRPADWIDVAPMIAEAMRTRTDSEALAYWRTNNGQLANQPADHKKLKDAVAAHRQSLREQAANDARTVDVQATPVAAAPAPAAEPRPLSDAEIEDADLARTGGQP